MKIQEITNYLECIAPLEYQEDYDNSGLIVGNKNKDVKGVLITLDCTEEVIEEAILQECNLIIAHHPMIFSGIKKINGNNYTERSIIKAIKNDIAVYAIHTNLDNIKGGVNDSIADKLCLENRKILLPKNNLLRQLVVYCPIDRAERLRKALFSAGAGTIGNYDSCSFFFDGTGSFRAGEFANPYIGERGELHTQSESRIEVVYSKEKENEILNAMYTSHPYEEVAYQIYMIQNKHQLVGSGIIGELKKSLASEDFLNLLKENMKLDVIRHTSLLDKKIKRVALCGGSGSFLLEAAKNVSADIFISSDFKYHQFFDADQKIIIADIGHYESECYTKQLIYDLLVKKFTKFAIQLSKVNTNPINYLY